MWQCWVRDQRCWDQDQARRWKSHRLCTMLKTKIKTKTRKSQDQDRSWTQHWCIILLLPKTLKFHVDSIDSLHTVCGPTKSCISATFKISEISSGAIVNLIEVCILNTFYYSTLINFPCPCLLHHRFSHIVGGMTKILHLKFSEIILN